MVLRLRKRDCLGKEKSIFAEDWLVGALQIWLQLDMVTDMLLFLWIIRTIIALYLFFYHSSKRQDWGRTQQGWIMHFCVGLFVWWGRMERTMFEGGFSNILISSINEK